MTKCIICAAPLQKDRRQTCTECVGRVRVNLADIEYAAAMLPAVILKSGYHTGSLPGGDALVMLADGSLTGGGPDDWPSDPTPIIAVLESWERNWRRTLGHDPAVNVATITRSLGYLNGYLDRAAETLPSFTVFATEIRELHHRLTHVAGSANDPLKAAAACFDCGEKRLIRVYRHSLIRPWEDRINAAVIRHSRLPPAEFIAAVTEELKPRAGFDWEGAVDDYRCAACGRHYDRESYFLALRAAANDSDGWLPVAEAARAVYRPQRTIRTWVDRCTEDGRGVRAACEVKLTLDVEHWRGPIVVWWRDVIEKAETVGRVTIPTAKRRTRKRTRVQPDVRVDGHACA